MVRHSTTVHLPSPLQGSIANASASRGSAALHPWLKTVAHAGLLFGSNRETCSGLIARYKDPCNKRATAGAHYGISDQREIRNIGGFTLKIALFFLLMN